MQHFFEWFAQHGSRDRPWLILGKGPSFGLRSRFDLSGYDILSLNHAVREQPVLLAHMIDLDVVDTCGATLLRHARHVVLPWYPHVENAPGPRSLEELLSSHDLLRTLASEGRLLWYDLGIAPRRYGPGPVVQAAYFSAEAAVSLLALAGVRRVRSLGVDGGSGYSSDFEDLARRTHLANGQPGFDLQFQGIARTMQRTGLDFAPLDQPSPMVVCVPSTEATALPERVLEFTIRKHASMNARLHRIRSTHDLETMSAAALENADAGGPSERRRAIVLSSSSLVFDDLRKLWARPFDREAVEVPLGVPAHELPTPPGVSLVTATDSHRLRELSRAALDLGRSTGEPTLPRGTLSVTASLPARWSRQDQFEAGNTSLLRYSAPGLQPWISRAHPFAHVWVATLLDAVRDGFVSLETIRTEVRLGHVRPSLLEQVESGSLESLLVSWSARRRDARWTPPDGSAARPAGLGTNPLLMLRALARHARSQIRAYRRRRSAQPA
ncbi:MAG: hypothetical protein H0T86_00665 [Gemmatimonadales bacterium]|nr:hypothetical protein [Gemmatimonadales bacterium]